MGLRRQDLFLWCEPEAFSVENCVVVEGVGVIPGEGVCEAWDDDVEDGPELVSIDNRDVVCPRNGERVGCKGDGATIECTELGGEDSPDSGCNNPGGGCQGVGSA